MSTGSLNSVRTCQLYVISRHADYVDIVILATSDRRYLELSIFATLIADVGESDFRGETLGRRYRLFIVRERC